MKLVILKLPVESRGAMVVSHLKCDILVLVRARQFLHSRRDVYEGAVSIQQALMLLREIYR